MKRYCLDTSGLTTPLEHMPADIHISLWEWFAEQIQTGCIAVTSEIYDELTHIQGDLGTCIADCKEELVLEIGEPSWDWELYLVEYTRMTSDHRPVISEYNQNRKKTIGLVDLSIIALGKVLGLPVISSESLLKEDARWRRIPNICDVESVQHLSFNDFLRREGKKL